MNILFENNLIEDNLIEDNLLEDILHRNILEQTRMFSEICVLLNGYSKSLRVLKKIKQDDIIFFISTDNLDDYIVYLGGNNIWQSFFSFPSKSGDYLVINNEICFISNPNKDEACNKIFIFDANYLTWNEIGTLPFVIYKCCYAKFIDNNLHIRGYASEVGIIGERRLMNQYIFYDCETMSDGLYIPGGQNIDTYLLCE